VDEVQQEGQLGHLRDGYEGRLQAGRHGQQRQHLQDGEFSFHEAKCTDKKENIRFLIYEKIQSGAVASSYMGNICAFPHILRALPHIYDFATAPL
jgi:hypothetical protein